MRWSWQRRPTGDRPGANPGVLVVGDAREQSAQLDHRRQFTVSLVSGTDHGGISLCSVNCFLASSTDKADI
jgi:hypothetical protein